MDYSSLIRSPNALTLLCLMLHETDEGKKPFTMSQTQMARILGITRMQVRTAIGTLLENNMIYPSDNQPDNQVITYLTRCKISVSSIPKTGNNQVDNQGITKLNNLLIKPKEGEQLTEIQDKYNKWCIWMHDKHLYLFKKMKQLSLDNFEALLCEFGVKKMCNIIDALDNDEKYRRRYKVLATTMYNWLKRREIT